MKLFSAVLLFFSLTIITEAQDITNTLAPNGNFKIKDGTTDYFILNQENGTINLVAPNAGNIRGSIFKGGSRFLHTYYSTYADGYNTFLGIDAGNFTMGGAIPIWGSYNTGVGNGALNSNMEGYYNSAFGVSSLRNNTSGNHNSAFGVNSLHDNSTGYWNSAFGFSTLRFNTNGIFNSAFGVNSLYTNSSGNWNSAFGVYSLYDNSTGNSNSAFGFNALSTNATGNENSAFGCYSLYINSTGNFNSAFGNNALRSNWTGYQNVGIGTQSLYSNTTGNLNTAVGHKSLYSNSTGFQNTAVGDSALYSNTGNYNTAIGYNAGSNVTSGANLTLIGIDANPSSPTALNQITLGNQFVSSLRCNVQTITSLSDARDKKNIQDLTLGLDFIIKLKPRQFNWDRRDWYKEGMSDGSKMYETPTAGFIAQELDEVQNMEHAEWLNLVLKDNPDKWEATYGNLLPVIVKAIQELQIQNEKLKIENAEQISQLVEENNELKSEIENLKLLKKGIAEIQELKAELIKQVKLLNAEKKMSESKFTSTSAVIE